MVRGTYQKNKNRRCSKRNCPVAAYGKTLCKRHYQADYMRQYRTRNPLALRDARKRYRKSEKGIVARRRDDDKRKEKLSLRTPPQKRKERERKLCKKYGLVPSDYRLLRTEQNNKCKVCGCSPRRGRQLCVDHCHRTGRVRGLLCVGCNIVVGFIEVRGITIEKVLSYLAGYANDEQGGKV